MIKRKIEEILTLNLYKNGGGSLESLLFITACATFALNSGLWFLFLLISMQKSQLILQVGHLLGKLATGGHDVSSSAIS